MLRCWRKSLHSDILKNTATYLIPCRTLWEDCHYSSVFCKINMELALAAQSRGWVLSFLYILQCWAWKAHKHNITGTVLHGCTVLLFLVTLFTLHKPFLTPSLAVPFSFSHLSPSFHQSVPSFTNQVKCFVPCSPALSAPVCLYRATEVWIHQPGKQIPWDLLLIQVI